MSSHFDKMEEELKLLSANMETITTTSEDITSNLKGRRHELTKLANTHEVLTRLQFLFELSPKMRESIEQNRFNEAVKYYLRAERTLEQYSHFPSIQAIKDESLSIAEQLRQKLYQQLSNREVLILIKFYCIKYFIPIRRHLLIN